ncbi:arsenical pump-driving ATPase [Metallumcola ferriviriculae]|uniref:Arsenical pump-driving ATPase n=1 Tax=Metallumcola ferriviriculae TaxID=3039180 RepID=A0AAU0UME7_9FIRM|nr:arsenical pump-driving ATPase [Desulfitibacteraceae bacterium MK1]
MIEPLALTPYLFFTGKGGVGKTSIACATAISAAKNGKKVLLVSTDPASNLDDVLEMKVSQHPAQTAVAGLWALNLDPEEAARDYRESVVEPYRGVLPDEAIISMEEQLSGACTVEIAAFNMFCRLLDQADYREHYDHIVFDTAPTGHTLRLLSLPKAWTGFLGQNQHGTSCIGPLAGLEEQRQQYEHAVAAITDGDATMLFLVARPEESSLAEAYRASDELKELGLECQRLIINGVFTGGESDDAGASLKQRQAQALENMPQALKSVPLRIVPLLPVAPVGLEGLRLLADQLAYGSDLISALMEKAASQGQGHRNAPALKDILTGLKPVVSDLRKRENGIVLAMGKGGVGKTTVAAATALALFNQGHTVHLSTTDPAAHLEMALSGAETAGEGRLTVSRIDPELELKAYRQEVMDTVGAGMDEDERQLLAEDLASPCTEEIAIFRAFARVVDKVEEGFVVLDTAPTGHTLLLLDNTQSYHREVERSTGEVPKEVRQLLPRLRDPELTHVLVVTLAQATPVLEASRLQDDLRRAGIEPAWWVINQTWTGVPTEDPILKSLARAEIVWLAEVTENLAEKVTRIPWQVKEPKGLDLMQLL